MASLKWSASHAVFVTEIDDEHKEIFAAVSTLERALSAGVAPPELQNITQRLVDSIVDHFAHEERLMRAARYSALQWHKQKHEAACKRVVQFVSRMLNGDGEAGFELVGFLKGWLRDHTAVADRMMAAFLRNQRRCMSITFRAGTKPPDSCAWVNVRGEAFDPRTGKTRT